MFGLSIAGVPNLNRGFALICAVAFLVLAFCATTASAQFEVEQPEPPKLVVPTFELPERLEPLALDQPSGGQDALVLASDLGNTYWGTCGRVLDDTARQQSLAGDTIPPAWKTEQVVALAKIQFNKSLDHWLSEYQSGANSQINVASRLPQVGAYINFQKRVAQHANFNFRHFQAFINDIKIQIEQAKSHVDLHRILFAMRDQCAPYVDNMAEVRKRILEYHVWRKDHVFERNAQWNSVYPIPNDISALLDKFFTFGIVAVPSERPDLPLTAEIVALTFSDEVYRQTLKDAKQAVFETSLDYDTAFETQKDERELFDSKLRDHAKRVDALQSDLLVKVRKLNTLRRAIFEKIPQAEASNDYKATQRQIARQEAILGRLGMSLAATDATKGDAGYDIARQNVLESIEAVEKRIEALEGKLVELQTNEAEQRNQVLDTAEMAQLRTQIARIHLGIDTEVEILGDYADQLFNRNEELVAADLAYSSALNRHETLTAQNLRPLHRIHATEIFDAQFTNRFAEMRDLNKAIKAAKTATFAAALERDRARQLMLEASQETTIASEFLEEAIMQSASGQLALEALMQAKDGLDASKAGPYVFLAWAGNRLYQNKFHPPPVYEPEYRLDGEQSVAQQILEGYTVKGVEDAAERSAKWASKQSINYSIARGTDFLKLGSIEKEINKIVSAAGSTTGKPLDRLTSRFLEQAKIHRTAKEALSTRLLGAGKGKFAKAMSYDLLLAQGKSLGVEAIKREIADFFEGHAWRNYMKAQQRFVLSVRIFRTHGNIYWRNQDTLEQLLQLRRDIRTRYFDSASNLQIEKSEPFDVKEGLRFWLVFLDEDGLPSKEPQPGALDVYLNAVRLTRKAGSNIFDLSARGAKELRQSAEDRLVLKVDFH